MVLILTEDASGKTISQGSGFIIEGNQIVTNAHVVRGGRAFVQTGVAKVPCTVSRVDEKVDLAVLQAVVALTSPALRAAPANTPIGTRVFALGNPQGLERTITEGLYTGRRVLTGSTLLQISAPLSPGSSGGPVVDSNGLVVGVAVGSLETGQNLNFAVPVDTLIALLEQPASAGLAPATASAPAAGSSGTAAPPAGASASLQAFYSVQKQRLAIRLTKETTPQWLGLRKQERDLLAAALNASRTDDELRQVVAAASNGHNDIGLDAARLALKRAEQPAAWHYVAIAEAALDFSDALDDPRRTELRQEAKTAVLKALPLKGSADVWLLSGQIHDALRDHSAARSAFNLALTVGPSKEDRPAVVRGLWRSAAGLNNEAEAARWYAELLKTGAATDQDRADRAAYYGSLKRWADAADIFEAIARQPTQQTSYPTYELWYSVAYARWMAGDANRALAAADIVMGAVSDLAQAQPTVARAQVVKASILLNGGSFEAAVEASRAAVAADPTLAAGHTLLARGFTATQRFLEAEAEAREAVRLSKGTDTEALATLAKALAGQRDWGAAALAFVQAAGVDAANPYFPLNAAVSYENAGRVSEAIRWYEETLRRDPGIKERAEILAAIAKLKKAG